MRVPAIKASIGNWTYYTSVMSFEQINQYVQPVNEDLHKSKTLTDLIQRSITDNYKAIKKYILEQDERFFNSLVLAVYEGDPQWIGVDFDYEEDRFDNLGVLQFTGGEKIFPVDGQHRVEGIKSALREDDGIATDSIPIIFIGHRNTEEGRQKTRRLFSTLNRYAKPVSMTDIIALDEDDLVAIVTRYLIEDHELFQGKRVALEKTKAIPEKNKDAFTSIETLYACNYSLLGPFLKQRRLNSKDFLRIRPEQRIIDEFKEYLFTFWDEFVAKTDDIHNYLSIERNPAVEYRNKENGGNLLFRPVGLQPFIQTVVEINKRSNESYEVILAKFNEKILQLNEKPWKQVLWNDYEKKMLTRADRLVQQLLMFMYNPELLKPVELRNMKNAYSGKLNINEGIEEELEELMGR